MKKLLCALSATLAIASYGAELPSADAVLKTGLASAKKENKVVFLAFHASWCGWCKKLDGFLNAPTIKPIVERRMQVVWIDCLERPNKKSLENAGWEKMMDEFKAKEAGLPSFFILDSSGKTLASSIREKEGNTGYPGEKDEIEHFLNMMKSAKLSASELTTVKAKLEELAAQLKH